MGYIESRKVLHHMKNIPSFKEFNKYSDFLETTNESLVNELRSLEGADPDHSVNEGHVMNAAKNLLSKFFLGPLSRVNAIDQARKIILELELDLIEKRDKYEKEAEELDSKIDELTKINDKEKIISLEREREMKAKQMDAYVKAQKLKIQKSKDVASKIVDGNARRKEYLDAGYAEDEIAIAELEYKLASQRVENKEELGEYEARVKKAKEEADAKAAAMKDKAQDSEKEEEKKQESPEDLSLDPQEEKKKVSSRKYKDIITRKNELEKDIADLRSDLERKLNKFKSRISANSAAGKKDSRYSESVKVDLLEICSALDSKINLLKTLRNLGKTEKEVDRKLGKESEFTQLADRINQSILDGEDANSGTKKIISDLFVSSQVTPQSIEEAKRKITEN
jgi:hypothetical protein